MIKNILDPRIIVALDYADLSTAKAFIHHLHPVDCRLKIGKHMFMRFGPAFVRELVDRGFSVFLDLKFHDIPHTVADACTAAAELDVWMISVHVMGGKNMLEAARHALDKFPLSKRPLLIAVTVLTSLDDTDLSELGFTESADVLVEKFARLAKSFGADGVICSAHEASFLRKQLDQNFLLVTPGIRLKTDKLSDQKRVMTPRDAFSAGADYLVIGRSITESDDPIQTLRSITLHS